MAAFLITMYRAMEVFIFQTSSSVNEPELHSEAGSGNFYFVSKSRPYLKVTHPTKGQSSSFLQNLIRFPKSNFTVILFLWVIFFSSKRFVIVGRPSQ
jgi:hypothetical protein